MSLISIDHLTGTRGVALQFGDGMTIAEMVEASHMDRLFITYGEVWITDPRSGKSVHIARELWGRVRPKPGYDLVIRAYGGKGGGGKSMLSIAMMLAVMATTSFATFGIAGAAWSVAAFGAQGAGIVGGLVGTAVGIPCKHYRGKTVS